MPDSKTFLLILLPFSLIGCVANSSSLTKYYVRPVEPYDGLVCHCPVNATYCETLDTYTDILANLSDTVKSSLSLDLIFLCGYHTLLKSPTDTTNVSGLQHLSVQGYGNDPSRVVVEGINLVIHSVPSLCLENVTIKDVSFQVYPLSIDDHVLFSITNCYFNHSHSVIVGSHLTIQDTVITDGVNTAFYLIQSILLLKGRVLFFGNHGERGGALELTSTKINISINADVTFANNYAVGKGGAIFVNNPAEIFKVFPNSDCFYHLLDYSDNAKYNLTFTNNSASGGGNHIFGVSLKSYCVAAIDNQSHVKVSSYIIISKNFFHFSEPSLQNNSISSAVTSSPARLCICNDSGLYGIPMCLHSSKIFLNVSHYPGELFTLPAVLVGADFGPTTGIVHAKLLIEDDRHSNQEVGSYLDEALYSSQLIRTTDCTFLNYVINSNQSNHTVLLQLTAVKSNLVWNPNTKYREDINKSIEKYYGEGVLEGALLYSPVFVNVTLRPCPLGFSLFQLGTKSRCDCYQSLKNAYKDLKCRLSDSRGYIQLPKCWIGTTLYRNKMEVVVSNRFCPYGFCVHTDSEQWVNVQSEELISLQCTSNRAGRLCGGCKEGYSLAIGSSSCVECSNNNGLALLIFFAVAGLLLVLLVMSLNITVTQGMINGVIFYANIIWIYEGVLFPREYVRSLLIFKIFIAWLNLDFGIEMCFVKGLDTFWKTLLQYLFPLYIFLIVGLIIWGARQSSKLTRLLGSKAVSALSSLILLSYTKLLRNVYQSIDYAKLFYYNSEERVHTLIVWAEDGRLRYVASQHGVLFFIALIVAFLYLAYTLVLLFGQWLRCFSCFSRFHPIFDSYFAPIKSKHHYLLGVVLITRVVLYAVNIVNSDRSVVIFILLITSLLLLSYMAAFHPLRSKVGHLFYASFLVNLIIVSSSILLVDGAKATSAEQSKKIAYITGISTAVAFLQFSGLVVYHLVKNIRSLLRRLRYQKLKGADKEEDRPREEVTSSTYSSFRDSILEDTPQLLISYS